MRKNRTLASKNRILFLQKHRKFAISQENRYNKEIGDSYFTHTYSLDWINTISNEEVEINNVRQKFESALLITTFAYFQHANLELQRLR